MEFNEINNFIVSDELLKTVKGLSDEEIDNLYLQSDSLNNEEKQLVNDVIKYFGKDFFTLSKSGREDRIRNVESKNNELKKIKTDVENHSQESDNVVRRRRSKASSTDGKKSEELLRREKSASQDTINSVSSLEKENKAKDILKQNKITWNIYKFITNARYNHPGKTSAVIFVGAVIGVSLLNAGPILGIPLILTALSPVAIAQYNKHIKKMVPNLEDKKSNLSTEKNGLKNALLKNKSIEKIISAVKGFGFRKDTDKKAPVSTVEPDKNKDKEPDKTPTKSFDINKLIEEIKSISFEDRKYENIEKMRLLLTRLDVMVSMGATIPDDNDLKIRYRIGKMRDTVKKYDSLMSELDNLYNKKDDKSLENMKKLHDIIENIANEYQSLTDDNKKKFQDIANIVQEFDDNIEKSINEVYTKLGDLSKDNIEELVKFSQKIDNYMFAIDDDELKKKVKEIKNKVAEYKNNNSAIDDKISKLNVLFDNLKDEEIYNMPLEEIKGIINEVDKFKDKLSENSKKKYALIMDRKNSLENPKKDIDEKHEQLDQVKDEDKKEKDEIRDPRVRRLVEKVSNLDVNNLNEKEINDLINELNMLSNKQKKQVPSQVYLILGKARKEVELTQHLNDRTNEINNKNAQNVHEMINHLDVKQIKYLKFLKEKYSEVALSMNNITDENERQNCYNELNNIDNEIKQVENTEGKKLEAILEILLKDKNIVDTLSKEDLLIINECNNSLKVNTLKNSVIVDDNTIKKVKVVVNEVSNDNGVAYYSALCTFYGYNGKKLYIKNISLDDNNPSYVQDVVRQQIPHFNGEIDLTINTKSARR